MATKTCKEVINALRNEASVLDDYVDVPEAIEHAVTLRLAAERLATAEEYLRGLIEGGDAMGLKSTSARNTLAILNGVRS